MIAFLFPAVLAIVGLVLVGRLHRDLPPRAAAFAVTAAVVMTAVTSVWSIGLLAADFLIDLFEACREPLRGHVHVSSPLGVAAFGALAFGAVSSARSLSRHHRARRGPIPEGDLLIIDDTTPTAFAVPGRHPHVVVSTAMLALLDADERRAMLAHERAHLRHHHHRFVVASELSAAVLPLLWPAARRVRFATERWADQEAVREVGDPNIVARAIARAALARSGSAGSALALAGGDVVARIEALTGDGGGSGMGPASLAIVMLVAISVIGVLVQLHHVIEFVQTFCVS
jgi:Zn-dependent protease with chaperone function